MHSSFISEQELSFKSHSLLKKFYGYDSFYPLQYDAIQCVNRGDDCLVLMPTGGGKSLCFQIPALLFDGCCIVVSPLISLMKDQVDSLCSNGIPAAAINSSQDEYSNREILENVFKGRIKLLYISPERLLSEMDQWSDDMAISMIAIDEAHCISQWGHDFRPEYSQLSTIKRRFPNAPIMALTATADKLTRKDIVKQLGIGDAKIFLSSFDRPNLSLNVIEDGASKHKLQTITKLIDRHEGESGIIYCLSRSTTEKLAESLCALGYKAECYHAGLANIVREKVQKRFLNDDTQIMCATIAFGMGINKSNVRWVIHYNMPKSMESYYQEIGRAGRDGLDAETLMFYSYGDVITLTSFIRDSGQVVVNTEKLNRMQQYAESHVCRRRILLSYFNERYDKDCGNCDVCKNPPTRIDGTIIAQMALSAIIRCNEKIGISMLIDILRGANKADIKAKGYDTIKTYGIGRQLSVRQWSHYMLQFLQLGLFEIAYDEGNSLKVTKYGYDILKGNEQLEVSEYVYEQPAAKKKEKVKAKGIVNPSTLLSSLKSLRLEISKSLGVPAFIIFSDKVINTIAELKPTTKEEFSSIHGIGEIKSEKYWKQFTDVVKSHNGLL
ncbi:MAG: DNA helicase RecQ [Muribaculaceae bacterium]|nr:DNA helicase RecQ [Muribaculaceae bacterium]